MTPLVVVRSRSCGAVDSPVIGGWWKLLNSLKSLVVGGWWRLLNSLNSLVSMAEELSGLSCLR